MATTFAVRPRSRREGRTFITRSLDFVSYLQEMTPAIEVPGYPRLIANGKSDSLEWAFDDPDGRCDQEYWERFLQSESLRVMLRRDANIKVIKGRRGRVEEVRERLVRS